MRATIPNVLIHENINSSNAIILHDQWSLTSVNEN